MHPSADGFPNTHTNETSVYLSDAKTDRPPNARADVGAHVKANNKSEPSPDARTKFRAISSADERAHILPTRPLLQLKLGAICGDDCGELG